MKDGNVEHLAVLIDAENISHHRIKAILEDIAGIGDVLAKRIYGDFSTANNQPWIDCMKDLAIVPVFQPSYTFGKNSSDIALVIDAMDLLYTGRYDGFCLVTSDSDFTRLASRIREHGVNVYGYGRTYTNIAFKKACNKFTDIDLLDSEVVLEQTEAKEDVFHNSQKTEAANSTQTKVIMESPGETEASSVAQTQSAIQIKPKKLGGFIKVIDKAIYLASEDGDEEPLLTKVSVTLRRIIPDFNPKEYGFSKLTDMLSSTSRYQLIRSGTVVRIKILKKPNQSSSTD